MKRSIVMGMLFSILAFMLVSCLSTDGSAKRDSGVTLKAKDVSFKSELGSLKVQNNATEDVIIFAGKVEKNAILGGVYAGKARTFNLSKLDIPDTGCILIRAVTFNTYKGKARLTETDVIYTALVVYNLKDKNEKIQVNIYEDVDTTQRTCIYVSNESEHFILELRLGNPAQGEVVATLPPLQSNKRIYLTARDDGFGYDFYPTYIYVDPKTGEKSSMTAGKEDRKRAIPKAVGSDVIPLRFGGPSKPVKGYDVAFVSLKNDTSSAIEFRNAEKTLKNQKGLRLTESGQIDVYEIASTNGGAGELYSSLIFEFDNFTKKSVSPYSFKPGYKYNITVTEMNGNYQYDIREVGQKNLVEDARIELYMED